MKTWGSLCSMLALVAVVGLGCNRTTDSVTSNGATEGSETVLVSLPSAGVCATCGFEASETCCATAAEKGHTCSECKFAHGSPLCCVGLEPAEGKYCAKCGDVEGSETCCKGEACEHCGLQEGSVLCCKVTSESFTEAKLHSADEHEGESQSQESKETE